MNAVGVLCEGTVRSLITFYREALLIRGFLNIWVEIVGRMGAKAVVLEALASGSMEDSRQRRYDLLFTNENLLLDYTRSTSVLLLMIGGIKKSLTKFLYLTSRPYHIHPSHPLLPHSHHYT